MSLSFEFIFKIKSLIHFNVGGSNASATDIKNHPLFKDVDWEKLERKKIPSRYVPTINGLYDVQNFSEEFTQQPANYEPTAVPPNTFLIFKGLSFSVYGFLLEICKTKPKYFLHSRLFLHRT